MNSKETPNQLQGKFNHQEITRDFLKHELRQFEKQTGSGPHSSKEHKSASGNSGAPNSAWKAPRIS